MTPIQNDPLSPADAMLAFGARQILAAKQAIYADLPAGYVQAPAVPVLLTLFIAQVEGRVISHRAICAMLSTTHRSIAERWVKVLEHDGLVCRVDTTIGRGEPDIALTDKGNALVSSMVVAAGEAQHAVRRSYDTSLSDRLPASRQNG